MLYSPHRSTNPWVPVFISGIIATVTTISGCLAQRVLALPLSPGDRVRVTVPTDEGLPEGDRFSGVYEVNLDGTLQLPFISPLVVAGRETSQVETQLKETLLSGGFFQPNFLQVSVRIVQWGPVDVNIAGETFRPGRILINQRPADTLNQPALRSPVTGNYPPERYLTAALLAAGGVKPEADISNIRLIRGGEERLIDLSGVFSGEGIEDVPLIAGDRIIVPRREVLNQEIVRPSKITPERINVYLSNLSTPNQGGNIQFEQMPYGIRFSQAVAAAKCVGGSSADLRRRATLIQTDRVTGNTRIIDRTVEDLVRKPNDNVNNPFLMPDDAVVCYDSQTRNIAGLANVITTILNPFTAIEGIIRRITGGN